ncbi:hypothetical protein [Streptomyces sp. NBC_01483]|uniref:hypothetical protein n=1 Tax=Streptomyces sp. NBC_01483 TaxID=2903883 RepID=UPI002E318484|nr:hypothetical protein [Streptomyces sp. NBC_01483]
MTMQTIAPIGFDHTRDPDYFHGRADAYDDVQTLTLDELVIRSGAATDYASLPYALGYSAVVIELRMEADDESEIAQTWLARKQGREKSTLHTARRRRPSTTR